jgi:hypothetical protein
MLIVLALVISACLLRAQISSAVVTRGDDLAFWGNEHAAVGKYSLALWIDANNDIAADRFAFAAVRVHDPVLMSEAIRITAKALSANPLNETLIMDRALCLHAGGSYARAATDFATVGRLRRDARALTFAALDLQRIHRTSEARALLRTAIAYEPGFLPARRAFERSKLWRS